MGVIPRRHFLLWLAGESRGRDIQDSLRTPLHQECQMGKKAGEGVGDPPGCRTIGVAAKQLQ